MHHTKSQTDLPNPLSIDINGNYVFVSGRRVVVRPNPSASTPASSVSTSEPVSQSPSRPTKPTIKHAQHDQSTHFFLPQTPLAQDITSLSCGGVGHGLVAVAEAVPVPFHSPGQPAEQGQTRVASPSRQSRAESTAAHMSAVVSLYDVRHAPVFPVVMRFRPLVGVNHTVTALALSPDGALLAAAVTVTDPAAASKALVAGAKLDTVVGSNSSGPSQSGVPGSAPSPLSTDAPTDGAPGGAAEMQQSTLDFRPVSLGQMLSEQRRIVRTLDPAASRHSAKLSGVEGGASTASGTQDEGKSIPEDTLVGCHFIMVWDVSSCLHADATARAAAAVGKGGVGSTQHSITDGMTPAAVSGMYCVGIYPYDSLATGIDAADVRITHLAFSPSRYSTMDPSGTRLLDSQGGMLKAGLRSTGGLWFELVASGYLPAAVDTIAPAAHVRDGGNAANAVRAHRMGMGPLFSKDRTSTDQSDDMGSGSEDEDAFEVEGGGDSLGLGRGGGGSPRRPSPRRRTAESRHHVTVHAPCSCPGGTVFCVLDLPLPPRTLETGRLHRSHHKRKLLHRVPILGQMLRKSTLEVVTCSAYTPSGKIAATTSRGRVLVLAHHAGRVLVQQEFRPGWTRPSAGSCAISKGWNSRRGATLQHMNSMRESAQSPADASLAGRADSFATCSNMGALQPVLAAMHALGDLSAAVHGSSHTPSTGTGGMQADSQETDEAEDVTWVIPAEGPLLLSLVPFWGGILVAGECGDAFLFTLQERGLSAGGAGGGSTLGVLERMRHSKQATRNRSTLDAARATGVKGASAIKEQQKGSAGVADSAQALKGDGLLMEPDGTMSDDEDSPSNTSEHSARKSPWRPLYQSAIRSLSAEEGPSLESYAMARRVTITQRGRPGMISHLCVDAAGRNIGTVFGRDPAGWETRWDARIRTIAFRWQLGRWLSQLANAFAVHGEKLPQLALAARRQAVLNTAYAADEATAYKPSSNLTAGHTPERPQAPQPSRGSTSISRTRMPSGREILLEVQQKARPDGPRAASRSGSRTGSRGGSRGGNGSSRLSPFEEAAVTLVDFDGHAFMQLILPPLAGGGAGAAGQASAPAAFGGGLGIGQDILLTSNVLAGKDMLGDSAFSALARRVVSLHQQRLAIARRSRNGELHSSSLSDPHSDTTHLIAAYVEATNALGEEGLLNDAGLRGLARMGPSAHGGAVISGRLGYAMAQQVASTGALLHPAQAVRARCISTGLGQLHVRSLHAQGSGKNGQGAWVHNDEQPEAVHKRIAQLQRSVPPPEQVESVPGVMDGGAPPPPGTPPAGLGAVSEHVATVQRLQASLMQGVKDAIWAHSERTKDGGVAPVGRPPFAGDEAESAAQEALWRRGHDSSLLHLLPDTGSDAEPAARCLPLATREAMLQQAGVGIGTEAARFMRLTDMGTLQLAQQQAEQRLQGVSAGSNAAQLHNHSAIHRGAPTLVKALGLKDGPSDWITSALPRAGAGSGPQSSPPSAASSSSSPASAPTLQQLRGMSNTEVRKQEQAFLQAYRAGTLSGVPLFLVEHNHKALQAQVPAVQSSSDASLLAPLSAPQPPQISNGGGGATRGEWMAAMAMGAFGTLLNYLGVTASCSARGMLLAVDDGSGEATVGSVRSTVHKQAIQPVYAGEEDLIGAPASVVEAQWTMLDGHAGAVCGLALHPSFGSSAATAEVLTVSRDDATVRIWNMCKGNVNTLLAAPLEDAPMKAAWHPAGHMIALHIPSGVKLVWRTMSALPCASAAADDGSSTVNLDPLGMDENTTRENFAHGLFGHDYKLVPAGTLPLSSVGALSWSPSGALLAVGTDRCTLLFGVVGGGATGGGTWGRQGLRVSAKHGIALPLASGGVELSGGVQADGMLRLVGKCTGHGGLVTSVAWDGNGARLATGADDGSAFVFDVSGVGLASGVGPSGAGFTAVACDPLPPKDPHKPHTPATASVQAFVAAEAEAGAGSVRISRTAVGYRALVVEPLHAVRMGARAEGTLTGRAWGGMLHIPVPLPCLWGVLGQQQDVTMTRSGSRGDSRASSMGARGGSRGGDLRPSSRADPAHDLADIQPRRSGSASRSRKGRRRSLGAGGQVSVEVGGTSLKLGGGGAATTTHPAETTVPVLSGSLPGLLGSVPQSVWGHGGIMLGLHWDTRQGHASQPVELACLTILHGLQALLGDVWAALTPQGRHTAASVVRPVVASLVSGVAATLTAVQDGTGVESWLGGAAAMPFPVLHRQALWGSAEVLQGIQASHDDRAGGVVPWGGDGEEAPSHRSISGGATPSSRSGIRAPQRDMGLTQKMDRKLLTALSRRRAFLGELSRRMGVIAAWWFAGGGRAFVLKGGAVSQQHGGRSATVSKRGSRPGPTPDEEMGAGTLQPDHPRHSGGSRSTRQPHQQPGIMARLTGSSPSQRSISSGSNLQLKDGDRATIYSVEEHFLGEDARTLVPRGLSPRSTSREAPTPGKQTAASQRTQQASSLLGAQEGRTATTATPATAANTATPVTNLGLAAAANGVSHVTMLRQSLESDVYKFDPNPLVALLQRIVPEVGGVPSIYPPPNAPGTRQGGGMPSLSGISPAALADKSAFPPSSMTWKAWSRAFHELGSMDTSLGAARAAVNSVAATVTPLLPLAGTACVPAPSSPQLALYSGLSPPGAVPLSPGAVAAACEVHAWTGTAGGDIVQMPYPLHECDAGGIPAQADWVWVAAQVAGVHAESAASGAWRAAPWGSPRTAAARGRLGGVWEYGTLCEHMDGSGTYFVPGRNESLGGGLHAPSVIIQGAIGNIGVGTRRHHLLPGAQYRLRKWEDLLHSEPTIGARNKPQAAVEVEHATAQQGDPARTSPKLMPRRASSRLLRLASTHSMSGVAHLIMAQSDPPEAGAVGALLSKKRSAGGLKRVQSSAVMTLAVNESSATAAATSAAGLVHRGYLRGAGSEAQQPLLRNSPNTIANSVINNAILTLNASRHREADPDGAASKVFDNIRRRRGGLFAKERGGSNRHERIATAVHGDPIGATSDKGAACMQITPDGLFLVTAGAGGCVFVSVSSTPLAAALCAAGCGPLLAPAEAASTSHKVTPQGVWQYTPPTIDPAKARVTPLDTLPQFWRDTVQSGTSVLKAAADSEGHSENRTTHGQPGQSRARRAEGALLSTAAAARGAHRQLWGAVRTMASGALHHGMKSIFDQDGGVTRAAASAGSQHALRSSVGTGALHVPSVPSDGAAPTPSQKQPGRGLSVHTGPESAHGLQHPDADDMAALVTDFAAAHNRRVIELVTQVRRSIPLVSTWRKSSTAAAGVSTGGRLQLDAASILADVAEKAELSVGLVGATDPMQGLALASTADISDMRQELVALRFALAWEFRDKQAYQAALRAKLINTARVWRNQLSSALLVALTDRDQSRLQSTEAVADVDGFKRDIQSKTETDVNSLVQRYERKIDRLELDLKLVRQAAEEATQRANATSKRAETGFQHAREELKLQYAAAAADMGDEISRLEQELLSQAKRHLEALAQAELAGDTGSTVLRSAVDNTRMQLRSTEIANEGKLALLRGAVASANASVSAAQERVVAAVRARGAEEQRNAELLTQLSSIRNEDDELRRLVKLREARVASLEAQLGDSERERSALQDEVAYLKAQLHPQEQTTVALRETLKGVVEESSAAARQATHSHAAVLKAKDRLLGTMTSRAEAAAARARSAEIALGTISRYLSDVLGDLPDTKVGLQKALAGLYNHFVRETRPGASGPSGVSAAIQDGMEASATGMGLKEVSTFGDSRKTHAGVGTAAAPAAVSSAIGEFTAQRRTLQRALDGMKNANGAANSIADAKAARLVRDNSALLNRLGDLQKDNAALRKQLASARAAPLLSASPTNDKRTKQAAEGGRNGSLEHNMTGASSTKDLHRILFATPGRSFGAGGEDDLDVATPRATPAVQHGDTDEWQASTTELGTEPHTPVRSIAAYGVGHSEQAGSTGKRMGAPQPRRLLPSGSAPVLGSLRPASKPISSGRPGSAERKASPQEQTGALSSKRASPARPVAGRPKLVKGGLVSPLKRSVAFSDPPRAAPLPRATAWAPPSEGPCAAAAHSSVPSPARKPPMVSTTTAAVDTRPQVPHRLPTQRQGDVAQDAHTVAGPKPPLSGEAQGLTPEMMLHMHTDEAGNESAAQPIVVLPAAPERAEISVARSWGEATEGSTGPLLAASLSGRQPADL